MNTKAFILVFFVLVIVAFKPAEHITNTNSAHDNGWIELINGKDFAGWKASENTGTWSVTHGFFQAVGKRSHLFYQGDQLRWV